MPLAILSLKEHLGCGHQPCAGVRGGHKGYHHAGIGMTCPFKQLYRVLARYWQGKRGVAGQHQFLETAFPDGCYKCVEILHVSVLLDVLRCGVRPLMKGIMVELSALVGSGSALDEDDRMLDVALEWRQNEPLTSVQVLHAGERCCHGIIGHHNHRPCVVW